MQFSLKHSKVIRTKTVIAKSKISIGAISISLLDKFFNNPESKKVLLIGFGELGQTIFKYLVDHNYNDLEICSSSHSKEVYATNSIYIPKQDIAANLYKYDIVICSSANARHIITSKDLISSMELRKYNTQVVIDLAVPCNVEAPKQLEHLYYYTNDELSKISASNMKNRKLALYQSDSYIEQALIEYKNWCDEQDKLPAVIELRNKYKELLKPLIAGSINRIERGHDPKEEIELFANKLLNKFLHSPTKALKNSNDKDLEFIIDLLV
jgi:glutamyl-tRNA reductase